MIDHTGISVAGVNRSAVFYDMALKALGLRRVMQIPENVKGPDARAAAIARHPGEDGRVWRRAAPYPNSFRCSAA
jgi:hypothetical protein